jgi:hypothetical protein
MRTTMLLAATQEAASATTDEDKLTGLSEAQLAWISHSPVCHKDRVPHICPVLADVGFHKPQSLTVHGVNGHGQDLLLVASDRWTAVESHICQNRADMGHPSLVTHRDLTTGCPRAILKNRSTWTPRLAAPCDSACHRAVAPGLTPGFLLQPRQRERGSYRCRAK